MQPIQQVRQFVELCIPLQGTVYFDLDDLDGVSSDEACVRDVLKLLGESKWGDFCIYIHLSLS